MKPAVALPPDVRLTHMATSALLLVFALLALGQAVRWVARQSVFDIHGITVVGDTQHTNSATLRANVAPRLAGTFFSMDLARVRAAFEAVPWVRRAVVQRVFPNRLRVVLQEHRPVALWGGDTELRLINNFGEVFEANVGEVEQDGLPVLSGPDGQGPEVLAMYRALAPRVQALGLQIDQLDLSGRGSWSVQLDTGASLQLGRGSVAEVQDRVQHFLKTLTQVVTRYGRQVNAVESADLRHEGGYALRLRGVSTVVADSTKK
jgi:cell division protein FtsQ